MQIKKCRLCNNSDLKLVLNLKPTPVADDFVGENQRNALGVFEGVTGTIELPEKELYYYHNNGNKIIFDEEVVDIFRQEEALYSPKIDTRRIPQTRKDWGEYLAKQAGANMYSKTGNQKKNIITIKGILLQKHFKLLGYLLIKN